MQQYLRERPIFVRPRLAPGSDEEDDPSVPLNFDTVRQRISRRGHGWFTFEQIITYTFNPGDDWEEALRLHGKISLNPELRYEITDTVKIKNPCCVLGNGAEVLVRMPRGKAFRIEDLSSGLGVDYMSSPMFVNVVFKSVPGSQATVFWACRKFILHDCRFLGMFGKCIESSSADVSVRGCFFLACYFALHQGSEYCVGHISKCVFENCVFGLFIKGNIRVSGNIFTNCINAVTICGRATLKKNSFMITLNNKPPVKLCGCYKGHILPLGGVHINSHPSFGYPRLVDNNFFRMRLYVRARAGMFHPMGCTFTHSVLCLDRTTSSSVSFYGCHVAAMNVKKVVNYDPATSELRLCHCGATHPCSKMFTSDITTLSTIDRAVYSCGGGEFSSDED